MAWFLLSLMAAFSWATSDVFAKKNLQGAHSLHVAAVRQLYAIPFFLAAVPFLTMPDLDWRFYLTIGVSLPLEVAAALLYLAAIKRSPLSLTLPYLSFTPVFMIVTAYLVLGETIGPAGIAGIVAVAAGAYVLNAGGGRTGILAPFKNVWHEKGSMMMLGVAFIYSFTSVMGKKGVLLSSSEFFAVSYEILLTVLIVPLAVLTKERAALFRLARPSVPIVAMGFFFAAMVISHFFAIRLIEAPYMISVKRTSMIFGVIYGWIVFKERQVGIRLAGSAIMLAGIVMILLL